MSDVSPPSATPRPARSGPGCLVSLVLLVLVVLIGIVIGTILNDEDDPKGETSATVKAGETNGLTWRVDAVRDVDGEECAFLYDDNVQLTGACDTSPQDATIGEITVVFGKAPAGSDSVRVVLDTGEEVSIDTRSVGFDNPFYVSTVRGDVDAISLASDSG